MRFACIIFFDIEIGVAQYFFPPTQDSFQYRYQHGTTLRRASVLLHEWREQNLIIQEQCQKLRITLLHVIDALHHFCVELLTLNAFY